MISRLAAEYELQTIKSGSTVRIVATTLDENDTTGDVNEKNDTNLEFEISEPGAVVGSSSKILKITERVKDMLRKI